MTPTDHDDMPDEHGAAEPDTRQLIDALTDHVHWLTDRLAHLVDRVDTLTTDDKDTPPARHTRPAPWVWFSPPAAAEDTHHRDEHHDPRFTLDNFVAYYNITYVGVPGTRATPIPDCWRHHPGLAAEIATLAYSWRHAHIGATAHPRDAQHWHHTYRPGFTDRLTEWTHPHCHNHSHRDTGAPPRPDRHTLADTDTG